MRVLVSGGAGVVGGLVAGLLRDAGHDTITIAGVAPYDLAAGPAGSLAGIDAVWHQAGVRPCGRGFEHALEASERSESDLAGLLRGLHAIGFAGRIVVMSSAAVYGETAVLCPEHGQVTAGRRPDDLARGVFDALCPWCRRPLSPQAACEATATWPHQPAAVASLHHEHLWNAYAWDHPGTTVTSLRCAGIYGPELAVGDESGVVAACLARLDAGQQPLVLEDGNQLRDLLHLDDATRAAVLALTTAVPFDGPLNIGTGRPVTVLEMATMLCAASGTTAWPRLTREARASDVRHLTINTRLAGEVLGFRARRSLPDGLADTWRRHVERLGVPA